MPWPGGGEKGPNWAPVPVGGFILSATTFMDPPPANFRKASIGYSPGFPSVESAVKKKFVAFVGLIHHKISVPVGTTNGIADQALGTFNALFHDVGLGSTAVSSERHQKLASGKAFHGSQKGNPNSGWKQNKIGAFHWDGQKVVVEKERSNSLFWGLLLKRGARFKSVKKNLNGDFGSKATGIGFAWS
jgi:hypothetical protein